NALKQAIGELDPEQARLAQKNLLEPDNPLGVLYSQAQQGINDLMLPSAKRGHFYSLIGTLLLFVDSLASNLGPVNAGAGDAGKFDSDALASKLAGKGSVAERVAITWLDRFDDQAFRRTAEETIEATSKRCWPGLPKAETWRLFAREPSPGWEPAFRKMVEGITSFSPLSPEHIEEINNAGPEANRGGRVDGAELQYRGEIS